MKFRFEIVYRLGLLVLLGAFFWTLWACAQPAVVTNAPQVSAAKTNAIEKALSRLDDYSVTFGLDRVDFLSYHSLFGEPYWKYIASLIFILLAFYVSKLLDFIFNSWLKRLATKTRTNYDDVSLQLLHGPFKVVAFVIFLFIGLVVFKWPVPALYLSRGLMIVVACAVTYLALKLVDLFLGVWREKIVSSQDKAFAELLFPLISKAAKIAIVVAATLITAENLEIEIKSLLAGLSVGGLALGLAAQDTVANLFGAVSIFLDKPFHIGDRIRVDVVDGMVESIGLRSTRVRSLDGHHVTIPNKIMGNAVITNVTRRPNIKTEMTVGLTYDTPVPQVRRAVKILEDIYRAHPQTEDLIVSFNKFADSALSIQVVHWWKGLEAKAHFAGMQELNLKIKERFDAEKIEFAFPTQTIYLKPEPAK